MIQHFFKRPHDISEVIANVICKIGSVKRTVIKTSLYSLAMLGCISATVASSPALAEDRNARAIMNSTHLLNFVDGVIPEGIPNMVRAIDAGKVARVEPGMPVWIISSDTGNILYYQGQKEFVGQAASRLVDDKGFRFGLRAVEYARNSKSAWVSLSLGGQNYRSYCATKAPFVVCSLVQ